MTTSDAQQGEATAAQAGRKVRTHDALVGVTGRLSRRLSSLAAGLEAAMAKICRELPLAEARLKEARMLAAHARKEAALLDELAEIDEDPPVISRRVDAREMVAGAQNDLLALEERGIHVAQDPIEGPVAIAGDPEPLRRVVRRFASYAGEVLGPGGSFRIAFREAGRDEEGGWLVRATFGFEGFRPRADDVDLDGGKLMTSIEADLRLASAIASVETCGGEIRVERHGPRSASVHAILPRAEAPRLSMLDDDGGVTPASGVTRAAFREAAAQAAAAKQKPANGAHAPGNGTYAPANGANGTYAPANGANGTYAPANGTNGTHAAAATRAQAKTVEMRTILVVEDQEAIRRLFVLGLESEGYRALEAPDGRCALAVLEAHEGPIEAVVTDRRMPYMGGDELARRVAQLRPETRIVIVTAHPPSRGELEPTLAERVQIVEKPTTITEILGALRRTA